MIRAASPAWFRYLLCLSVALGGCERGMHDMYNQPKYKPSSTSPLFSNHSAARTPPAGTVALSTGERAQSSSGRLDEATDLSPGQPVTTNVASTDALSMDALRRGRARYDIYCAACHGLTGEGDGMVVQRGFPAPSPFSNPRLVGASDAQLERAIRDGFGLMYPFADRLDPTDRMDVVAYIRALQLQQRVPAKWLDSADRRALNQQDERR